jgi:4-hydroxy-3-polyprenylbenzoate decarboxylase
MKRIVVGITGASGSIYAVRLLEALTFFNIEIHLVFSETADEVMKYETGLSCRDLAECIKRNIKDKNLPSVLILHDNSSLFASPASGSFRTEGMIIIPCTMACAGRIASCSGSLLLERAADVTLKEGRTLCIVARETPLNKIHLKNLAALSDAGAVIFPAMPSFYGKPLTIDDLVNSFISRVLDVFGLKTENYREWSGA